MTTESVRSNEDFFESARDVIIGSAPAQAQWVVISNNAVVGYHSDYGEALDAWSRLQGAVVEPLTRSAALVASNFLPR